ncbi:MAG: FitA-like ribbon-helix-helix domain-containing protein [Solirubrobacteraceae bacterium]
MGVLVQVRDVPEDVHRTMKMRAAVAGVSLSEYVRSVLARSTSRPTPAELRARIEARGHVALDEPSELAVRSIRDRGE